MKYMSNNVQHAIESNGWEYSLRFDGWVRVWSQRGEAQFLRVNNVLYKFGRTNWHYLKGPELISAMEEYL